MSRVAYFMFMIIHELIYVFKVHSLIISIKQSHIVDLQILYITKTEKNLINVNLSYFMLITKPQCM